MATVADIMTTDVTTLHPRSTLREMVDVLGAEEISGAPVVLDGEVVGVVSVTDLLEFEVGFPGAPAEPGVESEWSELDSQEMWSEGEESPSSYFVDPWPLGAGDVADRIGEPETPEGDELADHVVAEVMTRTVVAVPPETELREAARVMVEADVQRILVMDGTALEGIVTQTDIVAAAAEGRI